MGSNHEHGQHPAWVMISIHAPRMGSDNPACWSLGWRWIFQSTLPGWGATWTGPRPKPPDYYFNPRSPDGEQPWLGRNIGSVPMYFNPRSPDGERPLVAHALLERQRISIHAPRMGSDRNESACPQSQEISIHAPRMGSDVACGLTLMVPVVFQSTLPGWGATVLRRYEPVRLSGFQSTLPGWGATGHSLTHTQA